MQQIFFPIQVAEFGGNMELQPGVGMLRRPGTAFEYYAYLNPYSKVRPISSVYKIRKMVGLK